MNLKAAQALAQVKRLVDRLRRSIIVLRRIPRSIKIAVLSVVFLAASIVPFWGHLKHFVVSHDKPFWIDVFLGTTLLALIPFALAAYGGHLAAETNGTPKMRLQPGSSALHLLSTW